MTATDHVHRWSAMRFEIADGHPWVVETCAGLRDDAALPRVRAVLGPGTQAGERRRPERIG